MTSSAIKTTIHAIKHSTHILIDPQLLQKTTVGQPCPFIDLNPAPAGHGTTPFNECHHLPPERDMPAIDHDRLAFLTVLDGKRRAYGQEAGAYHFRNPHGFAA